jgi:hypothetical protein
MAGFSSSDVVEVLTKQQVLFGKICEVCGPPKANVKNLTEDDWCNLLDWCAEHETSNGSQKAAAAWAGCHASTIKMRMDRGDARISKTGPAPKLGEGVENLIKEWLLGMSAVCCSVPTAELLVRVRQYAERMGISSVSGSRSWYRSFLERHPEVAKRTPQLLTTPRLTAFTREHIARYFELLKKVVKDFPPSKIWNMDETGINFKALPKTVMTDHRASARPSNYNFLQVLAKRGAHHVYMPETGEDSHVSVVVTGNAAGEFLAPTFIFEGVRLMTAFTIGYKEATYMMSDSGGQEDHTFIEWCKLFVAKTGGKCALILDWHGTRLCFEAIKILRDAEVQLMCLHPHTTHRLQPMDVGFFGPFKAAIKKIMGTLRSEGHKVNKYNVSAVVKSAFIEATRTEADPRTGKITSSSIAAFEKCGVVPFNPDVMKDSDFTVADKILQAREELKACLDGAASEESDHADAHACFQVNLPVDVRLAKAALVKTSSRARRAEIVTGEEFIASELKKFEEKEAKQIEVDHRREVREAKKAAKAAAAAEGLTGKKRSRALPKPPELHSYPSMPLKHIRTSYTGTNGVRVVEDRDIAAFDKAKAAQHAAWRASKKGKVYYVSDDGEEES